MSSNKVLIDLFLATIEAIILDKNNALVLFKWTIELQ